jgi:hypothetical protein
MMLAMQFTRAIMLVYLIRHIYNGMYRINFFFFGVVVVVVVGMWDGVAGR